MLLPGNDDILPKNLASAVQNPLRLPNWCKGHFSSYFATFVEPVFSFLVWDSEAYVWKVVNDSRKSCSLLVSRVGPVCFWNDLSMQFWNLYISDVSIKFATWLFQSFNLVLKFAYFCMYLILTWNFEACIFLNA